MVTDAWNCYGLDIGVNARYVTVPDLCATFKATTVVSVFYLEREIDSLRVRRPWCAAGLH